MKNKSRTPKKQGSSRKHAINWDFADDNDEALKQVKGFYSPSVIFLLMNLSAIGGSALIRALDVGYRLQH